jgi:hypothetical protein
MITSPRRFMFHRSPTADKYRHIFHYRCPFVDQQSCWRMRPELRHCFAECALAARSPRNRSTRRSYIFIPRSETPAEQLGDRRQQPDPPRLFRVTALNPVCGRGGHRVPCSRHSDRYASQISAILCGSARRFPFRATRSSGSVSHAGGAPGAGPSTGDQAGLASHDTGAPQLTRL